MTPPSRSILGATIAGKYRIEREIGRGAMGVVCEARHVDLGKRVAIKLIESSLAQDGEVASRFRREARATGLIESENVVQVFDVGADDEVGLFMVMELLEGEDLCTRLEREGMLDVETSVRIALQIARALQKAHDAGVVHRDLKPANVFLVAREDGAIFVKILDFGISKILERESLARSGALKLTRAGTAVGTPQYASPEQAQGLDHVDHRTDIWSLGVLLYEMLSGKMAYPEMPTYEQFIIQLVTSTPQRLDKIAPWVPREVARIVDRAMRHHLDERIPSCDAFAKMLAQAVPSAAGVAARREPPRPAKKGLPDDTIQMDSMVGMSTPSAFELPPTSSQKIEPPPASLADLLSPDSFDVKTRVDASPFFNDDGERVTTKPPPPPREAPAPAPAPPSSQPRFSDPNPQSAAALGIARAARPGSGSTVSRRLPPPARLSPAWIFVGVAVAIMCLAALVWALLRGAGRV